MNAPANDTYQLALTYREAYFLINGLPPTPHFPEQYDQLSMGQMPGQTAAGGLAWRLKLIAMYSFMRRTWTPNTPVTATLQLEVTVGELWMLDMLFQNLSDIEHSKFSDEQPVMSLIQKVWDALMDAYPSDLDTRYLPAPIVERIVPPEVQAKRRDFLAEIDDIVAGASEGEQHGTQG